VQYELFHEYQSFYLEASKLNIATENTMGEQGKDKTFSACTTVRGKPSRMNPFEQEGLFRASSMIPTTRSSVTSSPCQPFPFGH